MTFFILSSNSPRYFVPATIEDRIQGHNPLIGKNLRHFVIDDSLGQPFGYSSFTDAGFPDQNRVILGPSA
jgi:hypothetical protein